jgi:RNA polymerase sigma-70 factor (ECF subfamily)
MLGSLSDAEDVVQDAWLRWDAADRAAIETPGAWLTTVVSRLALDRLRARQRDRADYVGPWLPEPVVIDEADPALRAERREGLSLGFLHVLERLKPNERIAFVLTEVFAEPHQTVSDVLGTTTANARQLAHRARVKLADAVPPPTVAPAETSSVLAAFALACASGSTDQLLHLLAPDVVLVSDGGAEVHAARRPVIGVDRVGRLLANLVRRVSDHATIEFHHVNGEPGLLARRGGQAWFVVALEADGDRVRSIHLVINPDKLRRIDRV